MRWAPVEPTYSGGPATPVNASEPRTPARNRKSSVDDPPLQPREEGGLPARAAATKTTATPTLPPSPNPAVSAPVTCGGRSRRATSGAAFLIDGLSRGSAATGIYSPAGTAEGRPPPRAGSGSRDEASAKATPGWRQPRRRARRGRPDDLASPDRCPSHPRGGAGPARPDLPLAPTLGRRLAA